MRWIPDIPVDRAKLRLTATYAVLDGLSLGIEWNPLDEDVGPLANWRVVDETERRPALILGTSSDRIGTPSGRAYYATLSKDLTAWTGLAVAPYAGAAYGEFDERVEAIGGLHIRWIPRLSSTHLWDGVNLHHTLDWHFLGNLRAGAVLVEQDGEYYGGVSLGASL